MLDTMVTMCNALTLIYNNQVSEHEKPWYCFSIVCQDRTLDLSCTNGSPTRREEVRFMDLGLGLANAAFDALGLGLKDGGRVADRVESATKHSCSLYFMSFMGGSC